MASRRRSRESALQMLYQWDVGGGSADKVVADYFDHLAQDKPQPVDRFAEQLFRSAVEDIEGLDEIIQRHARHWSPDRMSKVVRHLLRLAIGELRASQTPHRVVIDEALEIGKRFAGEKSTGFLNGVLEAARKEICGSRNAAESPSR